MIRGVIVIVGCLIASAPALSADQAVCANARSQATSKIDGVYVPMIDRWIKVSDALKKKGLDPERYPVLIPNTDPPQIEVLNITDVVKKLASQRTAAYQQIDAGINDCNKGFATYQKALDIAAFFATGGLSAVLPPQMTHIDASKILSGYPLGDKEALVPKARDDLLNSLNIGGDFACMIRDPLRFARGQCG